MKFIFIAWVFLLALAAVPAWGAGEAFHDLDVTLDLEGRTIAGVDNITLKGLRGEKEVRFLLREGSEATGVEMEGKAASFSVAPGEGLNEVRIALPGGRDTVNLRVRFRGVFAPVEKAMEELKKGVSFVDDGVMGPVGAFIPSSSYWFPAPDGVLSLFRVKIRAPRGYATVSEGMRTSHSEEEGFAVDEWETERPLDGLDLVTGRFFVEEEDWKGIKIYTFFLREEKELSSLYIRKTKEYIDLYAGLIGPYPFRKFAVVENFLPTGYGMPSFTLLGSSVLRLPFIPDTSLGHEIAHSWFGNSVFADFNRGNWVEALTTHVSDYLYEKRKGEDEAAEFRFDKLSGYKNYAGEKAVSLREFVDATEESSRAVGYNKGVMVFSMLEDLLGEEVFRSGLNEFYRTNAFRKASWEDIERAFEGVSGRDLGWFFGQWVERSGGPELFLEAVSLEEKEGRYVVSFRLRQRPPLYRMRLPLRFVTEGGVIRTEIDVREEAGEFAIELPERPASLEVDPGYTNFRILSDEELPPAFSVIFGDKSSLIVIPAEAKAREKYEASARLLSKDYNLKVIDDTDPAVSGYLGERSLFILGGPGENGLFERVRAYARGVLELSEEGFTLEGKEYPSSGTVLAIALKKPESPGKNVALFFGEGGGTDILAKAARLRYFTKSSYLVLKGKEAPVKGVFKGKKALKHDF